MDVAAQPGQGISRDLGRGEAAERQIDQFISHRHAKRVVEEGERDEEAAWRESERRHEAVRRERNRQAWHVYHLAAAERHRAVLESLIANHEEQAAKLMETDQPKGAA